MSIRKDLRNFSVGVGFLATQGWKEDGTIARLSSNLVALLLKELTHYSIELCMTLEVGWILEKLALFSVTPMWSQACTTDMVI